MFTWFVLLFVLSVVVYCGGTIIGIHRPLTYPHEAGAMSFAPALQMNNIRLLMTVRIRLVAVMPEARLAVAIDRRLFMVPITGLAQILFGHLAAQEY